MPPAEVFKGVKFRLAGFTEEDQTKYVDIIKSGGGALARYNETATHFLACSDTVTYDDPECVAARKNGETVVNQFWFEDCTADGVLVDPGKVMYMLPKDVKGIDSFSNLHVCYSGYYEEEKCEIERLVELTGAAYSHSFKIDWVTHLICNSPQSNYYSSAKREGITVVSKSWLEHCLIDWRIVPVGMHGNLYAKLLVSHTPSPPPTKLDCDHHPKYLKAATTERIPSKPAIRRPGSKIVRVLNFSEDDPESLYAYATRTGLTEKISIPDQKNRQDATKPLIKQILLDAYDLVLKQELDKTTLNGSFSFTDFRISAYTLEVTLWNVHPLPYTAVGSKRDKDRFVKNCRDVFGGSEKVPMDVAVWLRCIEKGVDGNVLRRHINMQHPNDIFGCFMTLYHAFLDLSASQKRNFKTDGSMANYEYWMDYGFRWTLMNNSLKTKQNMVKVKQEEKLRAIVRGDCKASKGEDQNDEPYFNDVEGLLTFVRDTFIHPAKHYQRFILAVLLMDYPKLLADVQEALYAYGKLPQLDK